MEKIIIDSDNWTFKSQKTEKKFIPYGLNYTPYWSGWAPDYFSDERWNEKKIKSDIYKISQIGANVLKIVLSYKRVLPDPQQPGKISVNKKIIERFEKFLKIAQQNKVRLIVTLEYGWHGMPQWFQKYGGVYSKEVLDVVCEFWESFAGRYKNEGVIFSYSFQLETGFMRWNEPVVLPYWIEYLKEKYNTIDELNNFWGSSFSTFEEIKVPGFDGCNAVNWEKYNEGTDENENITGSNYLYDYLLFREFINFKFYYCQALAVKKVDSKVLTSVGFSQWSPFFRCPFMPVNEGPARGVEFNFREIGKGIDFIGLHFYRVPLECSDEIQLRYLEVLSRYSYISKPVVLEEFNAEPQERNYRWMEDVFNRSRDFVSGWLVWTYQNIKKSDPITEVCGLFDENGRITNSGKVFKRYSGIVKKWKMERKNPDKIIKLDKKFLYTSGDYKKHLFSITGDFFYKSYDYAMESNKAVDNLLRKTELLTRK